MREFWEKHEEVVNYDYHEQQVLLRGGGTGIFEIRRKRDFRQ